MFQGPPENGAEGLGRGEGSGESVPQLLGVVPILGSRLEVESEAVILAFDLVVSLDGGFQLPVFRVTDRVTRRGVAVSSPSFGQFRVVFVPAVLERLLQDLRGAPTLSR